ncbi:MAG: Arc family DNA-binding protein [Oscillospiraceae bacterium]|nr:Arc family DNA-binding protein [Oscillospiraceae bacterium]
MEDEVLRREKALKSKDNAKKQILLRLAPNLWDKIALWAEDDFRSINSQIEYLLSEAVKNRYGKN